MKSGVVLKLKSIISSLIHLLLNYFVMYIPIWWLRKLIYKIFGMKLGRGTRICMKTTIRDPWNIVMGENSIINECCYIDGRGGLTIGKNTSISPLVTILTASHDIKSDTFRYKERKVIIGDHVFIGTRAVVLDGAEISNKTVIAANSTFIGKSEEDSVYSGVPAKRIKKRDLTGEYNLANKQWFL